MIFLRIWIFFCLSSFHAATAQEAHVSRPLTPELMLELISKNGPQETVRVLYEWHPNNCCAYTDFLSGIERGEREWIEIIPLIEEGVDAATSEELNASISIGLANNPIAILELSSSRFPISQICRNPLIEPSKSVGEALDKAQQKSVANVTKFELLDTREECLSWLQKSRERSKSYSE